ncbi:uncharacterized protein isoform X2 [Rhodnius prolixus]|uniref:uncharacterized protein isoform X2 n=1 Tax=Rhodnius prolixus TaxID=13249 RepID=UPI003D18C438
MLPINSLFFAQSTVQDRFGESELVTEAEATRAARVQNLNQISVFDQRNNYVGDIILHEHASECGTVKEK